jgi:P27 family predicted phage terminase small subunit
MRGTKPMSTARRRLTGNAGRRTINAQEPEPPPTDLRTVPRELVGNAEAVREWKRLAPMLQTIRQVTEADRAALIALCVEWSRYLEAGKHARPRILTASRSGYKMPNPWLAIQRQALAACLKLWPELGLTPSARSRVKMSDGPSAPGGDSFSEFDDAPTTAH